MALFDSVPRDLHEQVIAGMQNTFDAVTKRLERENDRLIAQLEQETLRYGELVKQLVEIKRHEHGMNPDGFDASTLQPEHGLGVKTLAAIDEFAAGDMELRRYLVGQANKEYRKRHDMEAADRDVVVAKIIAAGEQG